MKTTTTIDPIARALETLTEAGISFTIVDGCPDPGCSVCSPRSVSAAA
jgi:hypothetical protein